MTVLNIWEYSLEMILRSNKIVYISSGNNTEEQEMTRAEAAKNQPR